MKKIFISLLICIASYYITHAQNPNYTIDSVGGIYIVTGTYWAFTYDTLGVLGIPFSVTASQTKTRKHIFAAATKQDCLLRIKQLFGEAEENRVNSLMPQQ